MPTAICVVATTLVAVDTAVPHAGGGGRGGGDQRRPCASSTSSAVIVAKANDGPPSDEAVADDVDTRRAVAGGSSEPRRPQGGGVASPLSLLSSSLSGREEDEHGNGDSVSDSVGSLERCIDTINTSLSSWSQESRNFLSEFAKNIKEQDIIYWVQGLCPNREKTLALGERGLEGLDRAKCPSANFNDRVLKPVAARLRAKKVYCNIRDVCIRKNDNCNCMCAKSEEAERMAEVIGVIAKFAHQKEAKFIFQNCGGKSITTTLIPKIKKESSAPTIAFVNEDSYHLSFEW